jgi:protein SCO1/2
MSQFKVVWPLMLAALFSISACDSGQESGEQMTLSPVSSPFKNTDLTGLDYASDFALIDHTGQPRTLADYRGKAVVVFFGYMYCPDVCPTTMAEMGAVMEQMGPAAEQVQVLFITVDPERDTPEKLAEYVPAFDKRFVGLTAKDKESFDKVMKEFKVFYEKVPGKEPGSYTMNHTSGSYVFDPQGRIRLFVRHGQGPEPIAHDLKVLLANT